MAGWSSLISGRTGVSGGLGQERRILSLSSQGHMHWAVQVSVNTHPLLLHTLTPPSTLATAHIESLCTQPDWCHLSSQPCEGRVMSCSPSFHSAQPRPAQSRHSRCVEKTNSHPSSFNHYSPFLSSRTHTLIHSLTYSLARSLQDQDGAMV